MPKQKTPARRAEHRTLGVESATFRAASDGEFTGYAAVWDSIDSYGTYFRRGAFAKTIAERGDRIKVMWDHEELIGKVVEIREDEHGLWVKGKLTLEVARAAEVRALMQDGAVDTMSFMFEVIQKNFDKTRGATAITEVKLFEVSPVTFAANEGTSIQSVRADDFSKTLNEIQTYASGRQMLDALHITLMDIWYDADGDIARFDEALAQFHASYLGWAQRVQGLSVQERSEQLCENTLAAAFSESLEGRTLEELASNSSFSVAELRLLQRGECLPIESRSKLVELPPEVRQQHSIVRTAAIESLFVELRAGFSQAEKSRLGALLSRDPITEPATPTSTDDELDTELEKVLVSLKTLL